MVMRWSPTATFRDKFFVGKLMIPTKLFIYLLGQLGYKGTKRFIFLYRKTIFDLVENDIHKVEGEYKGEPRPYVRQHWLCLGCCRATPHLFLRQRIAASLSRLMSPSARR